MNVENQYPMQNYLAHKRRKSMSTKYVNNQFLFFVRYNISNCKARKTTTTLQYYCNVIVTPSFDKGSN